MWDIRRATIFLESFVYCPCQPLSFFGNHQKFINPLKNNDNSHWLIMYIRVLLLLISVHLLIVKYFTIVNFFKGGKQKYFHKLTFLASLNLVFLVTIIDSRKEKLADLSDEIVTLLKNIWLLSPKVKKSFWSKMYPTISIKHVFICKCS